VRPAVAAALAALALAGCGASAVQPSGERDIPRSLLEQVRPIGVGPRYQPPASGPLIGACRSRLGARVAAHVEVFAANRVVIVPAGIGTRAPRRVVDARIEAARCFSAIVTLDPTGVVFVRRGSDATLSELFRAWGQPLSSSRVASFRAKPPGRVVTFVDGRRSDVAPGRVPLGQHSEIVVEVGPYVPPHHAFEFAPTPHPD
jgi:hypothetical protein